MNEWACVCAGKGVAPGSGWSDCVKIARRDQVHLTAQQRQNRKTRSCVKCVCGCVREYNIPPSSLLFISSFGRRNKQLGMVLLIFRPPAPFTANPRKSYLRPPKKMSEYFSLQEHWDRIS
jgi:hypothetical protein